MTNIAKEDWKKAQEFETSWWADCLNTFGEELKQLDYAEKMGLSVYRQDRRPTIDLENKSVLDLGGGAASLLLKCHNRGRSVVVDPMEMPDWVLKRYHAGNIEFYRLPAEEVNEGMLSLNVDESKSDLPFDEVWIYNVLQHTYDPKKIIENAKKLGRVIRVFEWLDTEPHTGHPQTLREADLNEWLGGIGAVEILDKKVWKSYTKAYYGIFLTDNYNGESEFKK